MSDSLGGLCFATLWTNFCSSYLVQIHFAGQLQDCDIEKLVRGMCSSMVQINGILYVLMVPVGLRHQIVTTIVLVHQEKQTSHFEVWQAGPMRLTFISMNY